MKQLLLFVAVTFLINTSAFAQLGIAYPAGTTNNLTAGTSFSVSPTVSNGTIPATVYGQVTTLAGSGVLGFQDATGTAAQFNIPYAVAGDGAGNFYVADANNNAIRKVTSAGVVSTLAGNPATPGLVNGPIASALFNNPQGIAIDAFGNLFVSDYGNHVIREITAGGTVSTFYQYDATFGPAGLCFDNSGNLIVADEDESLIIKINTAGIGAVIAGSTYGYTNANGTAAQFANPEDVQADASGNIFVADYLNNAIREITPAGDVTTFAGSTIFNNTPGHADGAGTAATFNNPTGVALGSGNVIYVADLLNNGIRRIMPDGTTLLVAGDPAQANGATNGIGTAASFFHPVDLYIDGTGTGYVADARNGDIRQIALTGYTISAPLPAGLAFNSATGTISGTPTTALTPATYTITAYNATGYASTTVTVALGSGTAGTAPIIAYNPVSNYVPVGAPFTITPVNTGGTVPATVYGQVTTLAGGGSAGYTNAVGTAAFFNTPEAITGDAAGNIYVADDHNNAIRKIAPDGTVTTVAGSLTGAQGDLNGTGTAALFYHPDGIAMDGSGNLFISDGKNNKIKKITLPGGVVTTFAAVSAPAGLRFDGSGNLIVAAQGTNQVIQINPAGTITSIAGSGSTGSADGTGAAAQFNFPSDVTLDGSGNIFVADYLNNEIRKIAPVGIVTTFAGNTAAGYADGTGTAAQFNNPTGVALGSGSVIYVTDFVNNDIRKIMPDGTVSLVAGSPTQASGATNGTGTAALFNQPDALYIDGSGTGYVTEYQNSTVRKIILTGYTIDKTLPAGLTFDQTTGTISGTLVAPLTGVSYTVTAYNAYGYSTTTVSLSSYNNWIGGTTDWATASNWSANLAPAASSDIAQIGVVPYTGTAQPNLATSTTVGSVRFGTYNTPALTIQAGQTLTITNDLTVNSASTAIINGPGTISLGGTSVINPTASLTASLNAIIALAPSATLTNNGTFTLSSDINGSSSIDAIPAGASVNGPVSVQRYLNGGDPSDRGYRLLSSPVYAATTAGGNNVYSINYITNNSFVTCTNCTTTATTKAGNPTLYLYREDMVGNNTSFTSGNFRGIADINQTPAYNYLINVDGGPFNIPVGNGFLFFFRGDKTTVNPYTITTTPIATTLTTTGTLIQGPVTVVDWFTPSLNTLSYTPASAGVAGLNCVGNPYACSIDWNTFTTNNDGTGIYGTGLAGGATPPIQVLDPVSQTFGSYQKGLPPSNAFVSNIISSGQGFFVQANSAGAQLIFNETSKSAYSQNTGIQSLMTKPLAAVASLQYIRLQFGSDSAKSEQTVINFNNQAPLTYSPAVDVRHFQGTGQTSLSSKSSDLADLSIHSVPFPGQLQSQVVKLKVNATANGTYILKIRDLVAVPKLYDIWLMDAYKKDSVNLSINNSYSVDINKADSASFGANRLSIIIRQDPALAYRLLNFTASKLPAAPEVQLVWKTANEQNYTNFTVERSTDGGKTFNVLGGLQGTGAGTYSLLDKHPVTGQNLYRLKQEDINNTITYSKVVTIQYSDLSNNSVDNLNLYPNPASSSINLAIIATTDGATTYNIKFVNSSGLVVKQVNSSQPSWQGNISSLKPGTYFVRVFSNKDHSLVGRTKFVKL